MNTTLNINRLGLLLKRYFTENKQRELTFWGIATVVFMIMHQKGSVELFMYIAGFIFAARTFKIFNYTPSGMHYLLIPATHAEKLTINIILSSFYFFCMILITYVIGTAIGTQLGNLMFGMDNTITFELFQTNPNQMSLINQMNVTEYSGLWNTFVTFAIIQSIFMLGSIYFKGNAIGKTFLTVIGISIILVMIELFLLKVTFGTYHLNGQMINFNINFNSGYMFGSQISQILSGVFKYALIPFFWVVTYLRLTEKEV